jgi:hypothetical protein
MALEDYVREARAQVKALRDQADSIEKHLKELLRLQPAMPAGVLKDGQLKPTTWKAADDIERFLEFGKTTMKRAELIQILVNQKLVGGHDEPQRYQYANESIRRGMIYGYLKEDRSGTIHWIPGVRKSRVRKSYSTGAH